jgi:hypothetical protein
MPTLKLTLTPPQQPEALLWPSLEDASYVIVREVPASDWGYGGRTQLARRRASELAAQS